MVRLLQLWYINLLFAASGLLALSRFISVMGISHKESEDVALELKASDTAMVVDR